MAAGAIDNGLTLLLARLLGHQAGDAGFLMDQASTFIFSARSFEQRTELVTKIASFTFAAGISEPKHSYHYKVAIFLTKLLNAIISSAKSNKWIRNLAAHGSLSPASGELKLVPVSFDFLGPKALKLRGAEFADGLTLQQVVHHRSKLNLDGTRLLNYTMTLSKALLTSLEIPELFLEEMNRLAQGLGVTPIHLVGPHEPRPPRQRRPTRQQQSEPEQTEG